MKTNNYTIKHTLLILPYSGSVCNNKKIYSITTYGQAQTSLSTCGNFWFTTTTIPLLSSQACVLLRSALPASSSAPGRITNMHHNLRLMCLAHGGEVHHWINACKFRFRSNCLLLILDTALACKVFNGDDSCGGNFPPQKIRLVLFENAVISVVQNLDCSLFRLRFWPSCASVFYVCKVEKF